MSMSSDDVGVRVEPAAEPPPRHAWSQATDGKKPIGSSTRISDVVHESSGAAAGEGGDDGSSWLSVATPYETDSHLIPSLRSFSPLSEIGASEFVRTCCVKMESLAMTAHATAVSTSSKGGRRRGGGGIGGGGGSEDEYVVEGLLTHGKVGTLVKICVGIEGWRTMILFPRNGGEGDDEGGGVGNRTGQGLAPLLAANSNVLRASFVLHAETTAVGLLNLVLYRSEGAEELGRDDNEGSAALALVDYCARQMAALAAPMSESSMLRRQKDPPLTSAAGTSGATLTALELSQKLQSRSPLDELTDASLESEYKTCVSAVAAARYLCEHFDALPLGVQGRMLDAHDFPLLMVSLIEEPPWTRRRTVSSSSGETQAIWEKFVDNSWRPIPPADLMIVTTLEAQPWLALYHLLCSNACRERYGLDTYRKSRLLSVRKYLNDMLVDQLPVLADVARYLDQLTIMTVPEPTIAPGSRDGSGSGGNPFLLEQVDSVRERLVPKRTNWDDAVKSQYATVWSKFTDETDADLRAISEVYCGSEGDSFATAAVSKEPAPQPTSRPLEDVILRLGDATFRLRPVDTDGGSEGQAVPTEHGVFVRIKMRVERIQDDGETATPPFPILPKSCAVAVVSFKGRQPLKVELSNEELGLPTPIDTDALQTEEVPSSLPSREWRQLGSLEDDSTGRLILQLGFKRLSRVAKIADDATKWTCYGLDRAFMSKPMDQQQ